MTRVRLFLFLATALFVIVVGWFVSLLARGYQFDFKNLRLRPTGLLVVTSIPDGAQILINGNLESATNTTLSLPPGTFDVEIKKAGSLSWQKRLTLKKEEVTKVEAYLFPAAPSLSPLTYDGAQAPVVSPDGTKIAFANASGLHLLELLDFPIGFSREPKQLTDANMAGATFAWSPDSRQILLSTPRGVFTLTSGTFTAQTNLVNIEGTLAQLRKTWTSEEEKKFAAQVARTPPVLQDILRNRSRWVFFSPDENKVLFTASASAEIPDSLIPALPGSSTQTQARQIKEGKTYVYDIREDRNFWISDAAEANLSWFATSQHLILAEEGRITIMDYDGTNRQTVFAGPYEAPYAFGFPNATRLIILTRLGAANGGLANLYSLSLR